MTSANTPATRLATRLAFLVAGFGMAAWAPLVPFAKERLGVDDAVLGILLLCLGLGSVLAMMLTGVLSTRFGAKPIILAGGIGLAVVLPLLTIASTPLTLGIALLAFGASLGSIDVAMNLHAVEVERAAGRPMMSGFHALFSIGGLAGATLMTVLLSVRAGPTQSALLCTALMAMAIFVISPRLLRTAPDSGGPLFVAPHGIVLLLAALTCIIFLAEGAMLDWGALYITDANLMPPAQAGLGYILFSVTMTIGRLTGDWITARIGDRMTLLWGGMITVLGFAVLLTAPQAFLALTGFLLIGLGASNIVPVLFRQAGRQTVMPAGLAIAAVTTSGYAGILLGPALIGFAAHAVGLQTSFWMLAALVALVPLMGRRATSGG
ncbi:MAG: MFS transporter [Cereibacter sphaeroides]|uniref:MFS transporter n=1 Tax=Cereibacter sphaeroides TaxID=1063 RepID=A0A2W5SLW6_CERSP|nr:MAG: MFS transporter [Cereibacter sphaeroides]